MIDIMYSQGPNCNLHSYMPIHDLQLTLKPCLLTTPFKEMRGQNLLTAKNVSHSKGLKLKLVTNYTHTHTHTNVFLCTSCPVITEVSILLCNSLPSIG